MPTPLVAPTHRLWLAQHTLDLLAFGRRTMPAAAAGQPAGGAAWLDDDGRPRAEVPWYTWITCRTVHVYSLGALLGVPGAAPAAARALAGLAGALRDPAAGGWFHAVAPDGTPEPGKSCYDHAFVLLAATSAVTAGIDGADGLLAAAQRVFLDRFWDEDAGLCADAWDAGFTRCDPYRGLNANMHAVEAMLSAASVTGDQAWADRAVRVCRFAAGVSRENSWRLPEHFDTGWNALPDYNADRPDDPFKPFGATVGHGLEWARLFLHAEAAMSGQAAWLAEAAAGLFDRAVADGWHADGAPGFVYTTDWAGKPVVRDRMHWVAAEAIGAAAALHARTGEERYAAAYRQYWDYASEYLIDHDRGSWHHQLDPGNVPAATVWAGKPDLYHAFQATLIPRLPLYPMLARAIADGRLQ